MRNILIDAGPLIALFDGDDQFHEKTVAYLKNFQGRLITTWPVITETAHMLDFSIQTQLHLFEWIELGGLTIFDLNASHLRNIRSITEKYSDLPADLADVTLLITAQELNVREIITFDSDFEVFRLDNGDSLENVVDSRHT